MLPLSTSSSAYNLMRTMEYSALVAQVNEPAECPLELRCFGVGTALFWAIFSIPSFVNVIAYLQPMVFARWKTRSAYRALLLPFARCFLALHWWF